MGVDTRLYVGRMLKEGKSSSEPRLDVLKACAVLHLTFVLDQTSGSRECVVSYACGRPDNDSALVLKQGPGFVTVQ